MALEAIVLAGGLGTRLRSVLNDVPKCMAPVDGIPFIHFIVTWLKLEGVTGFIFSLGYKHEVIVEYLEKTFPELDKKYSIESTPLGTGGAIKKALAYCKTNDVVALNGDTLFNVDISNLLGRHRQVKAACSIALKVMKNFSRYGSVEINGDDRITAFNEKQFCANGLINGGIYVINAPAFLKNDFAETFSFEKDYLEKYLHQELLAGIPMDYYFIDIGIPEDYKRFQENYMLLLSKYKYHKDTATFGGAFADFFFEGLLSLID